MRIMAKMIFLNYEFLDKSWILRWNLSLYLLRLSDEDEEEEGDDDDEEGDDDEEVPEEMKSQIKETLNELIQEASGNSPVKRRKKWD